MAFPLGSFYLEYGRRPDPSHYHDGIEGGCWSGNICRTAHHSHALVPKDESPSIPQILHGRWLTPNVAS